MREVPDDISILSNLAAVHMQLGNFPQALTHARLVLEAEPGHVKWLYRCGMTYLNLERYTEAVERFERAKHLVGHSITLPVFTQC